MSELFTEEVRVDDLIGEGKKYKDVDALAKSRVHADQHIERLEAEMAELRTDLQARLTVEQMLDKIQKPTTQEAPREMPDTPRQETGEINLAEEISKALRTEREKERRDANLGTVRNGLKERFGADYNQKLNQIAGELNVSKEFLTSMAQTTPEGFFRLVDSVAKPDNRAPTTPPNPSRDVSKSLDISTQKDAAYYRNLRRENPDLYFSRKVQKELHDQAVRLGSSFYQN